MTSWLSWRQNFVGQPAQIARPHDFPISILSTRDRIYDHDFDRTATGFKLEPSFS
jgi:hypothetical protein